MERLAFLLLLPLVLSFSDTAVRWPDCNLEGSSNDSCSSWFCPDCSLVDCWPTLTKEDCPPGTVLTENMLSGGCCPACVQYLSLDADCTAMTSEEILLQTSMLPCTDMRVLDDKFDIYKDQTVPVIDLYECAPGLACLPPTSAEIEEEEDYYYDYDYDDRAEDPKVCTLIEPLPDQRSCLVEKREYEDWLTAQDPDYKCTKYDWEKICNPLGYFDSIQSQSNQFKPNQRKFCTSPDGDRLFGSAEHKDTEIDCKCSIKSWELRQDGNGGAATKNPFLNPRDDVSLHCMTNGNYESLQCDNGLCWCVDSMTSKPNSNTVHENLFQYLPCYNPEQHTYQYLRRCESREIARAQSKQKLMKHGLDWAVSDAGSCDGDGSFGLISCNPNVGQCQCVDKNRQVIRSYFAEIGNKDKMDCRCARDEHDGLTQLGCYPGYGGYVELQVVGEQEFCVDPYGVQKTAAYELKEPRCKVKTCQSSIDYCNNYNHDEPPTPLPCQGCDDIHC